MALYLVIGKNCLNAEQCLTEIASYDAKTKLPEILLLSANSELQAFNLNSHLWCKPLSLN
jgi:hypothetical protein